MSKKRSSSTRVKTTPEQRAVNLKKKIERLQIQQQINDLRVKQKAIK